MNYILDNPYAPVGDKYGVAQRWGHIHIVNRKWVDQSIAKRGMLSLSLSLSVFLL